MRELVQPWGHQWREPVVSFPLGPDTPIRVKRKIKKRLKKWQSEDEIYQHIQRLAEDAGL